VAGTRIHRDDEAAFAGIPSFAKLPLALDPEDLAGVDVAILGAPTDELVSYRPGARFGPRAIRAADPIGWSPASMPNMDVGVDPFEVLTVVDHGDVLPVSGYPLQTHDRIREAVGAVWSSRWSGDRPRAVLLNSSRANDVAARLLAHEGYRTLQAASGAECLEIVRQEAVDLILLDVMMPGMDGFEVCAALHDIEPAKGIPIVLLTAKDDMDTRLEGMHHGVSEFLTKPINRIELYARVRAQLHIVELARQLDTVERNLRRPERPRPGNPRPR